MIRHSIIPIAGLCLLLAHGAADEGKHGPGAIVRQADRILIESEDPRALFDLFSGLLQVPIAWPFTEQENYMSGSVSAGDVILEFYRYGTGRVATDGAHCTSLSLDPHLLDDALMELRILEIPYDPPKIHDETLPDGTRGPAWSQVSLPTLSLPNLPVSFFAYSPQFLNMEVRRMQFGNRLTLNGGGPLGIVATGAIILESERPEADEAKWIRFLGSPDTKGYLHAAKGPAFRFVRGTGNGIRQIILKVRSLEPAKSFLREHNLLGTQKEQEVYLASSKVQGLVISLAEDLP